MLLILKPQSYLSEPPQGTKALATSNLMLLKLRESQKHKSSRTFETISVSFNTVICHVVLNLFLISLFVFAFILLRVGDTDRVANDKELLKLSQLHVFFISIMVFDLRLEYA